MPTPRINPKKLDAGADTARSRFSAFEVSGGSGSLDPNWAKNVADPFKSEEPPQPAIASEPLAFDGGASAAPLRLAPVDDPFALGDAPMNVGAADAQPFDLVRSPKADAMGMPARGSEESAGLGIFTMDARLTDEGPPIDSGVTWRVFAAGEDDNKLRLVGEAGGGPVTLRLRPGDYFVHAAYGRAGITKKVAVGPTVTRDTLTLNAGGLRLAALVGDGKPLPTGEVSFDIYAPDQSGSDERVLVVSRAPTAQVIGLNAGIYQVVCRYGDANAIVRADIKVEPGKLTEATIYQQAARLTLKLVGQHGGEAVANTSWSVVTPAGESVLESVGAFPSVVLAEGEYTAIAKHHDKIYEHDFNVEAGIDREVEVLIE